MPSKYEALFGRLTRVLGTEPEYQEKINAIKDILIAHPDFVRQGSAIAKRYTELRREKDLLKRHLSDVQTELDAVEQLMESQFEVEGTTSIRLSNGDKIRIEPGIHGKVIDHEAFRQWCLQDEDLSKKLTLHSSTVASIIKEMLMEGLAEPPGTQAVVWNKVVFTSGGE